MSDTVITAANEERVVYEQGNTQFHLVKICEIVGSLQFQSGYRDRLQGAPQPRFHDSWSFERGRMVATFLLSTGREPPEANDITGLVLAYVDAEAADAVL